MVIQQCISESLSQEWRVTRSSLSKKRGYVLKPMKHYCEFAVWALPSLALLLYFPNNTISYYSIYSIRLPTVIDRKFGSQLCYKAPGYALPYEKVVSLLVRQHGGGWALWQMKDGSPGAAGFQRKPQHELLVPYQLHHFSSRMRQPSHLSKSSGLWLARKERKEDMKICILLVWANDSMDMLRFIRSTSDNGRFANDPA